MKTVDEVTGLFERLFNGGRMLKRLPKSRKDTDVILALAAASLDPRETYTEAGLNDVLSEWLGAFADPIHLDHVTLRRYLVDYQYLRRDVPGTRYVTNQAVINTVIEPAARSVIPGDVLQATKQARDARKKVATD